MSEERASAIGADDARWMSRALELARLGLGLTSPNPIVGAVVVSDGTLVGQGYHRRAGEAHAEVLALAEAGARARGATLYVTLEPCNHHGRTPPCVEAVLAHGVGRVVVAVTDPNARVRGGGIAALSAAGVDVSTGCLAAEARADNREFLFAMERGRPHVTLKWAMTLDGKIAAFDRRARWITGEPARAEAHRFRSRSDAVVVGIGTAFADDPALDVRLSAPWPREPLRVVVDSKARLPVSARVIEAGLPSRCLVAVADQAPPDRVARLVERGVTVLACKSDEGRVDLRDLITRLFAMDTLAILVEGGGALHGAFVAAGLVDRVAVFVAPKLIGGASAPTAVGGPGRHLEDSLELVSPTMRQLGNDWLIEADVAPRGAITTPREAIASTMVR